MEIEKQKKRFKIFKLEDIETGLRFDFYPGKIDHKNHNVISILEDGLFTIEPVFYKVIDNYEKHGHWKNHLLNEDKIEELLF